MASPSQPLCLPQVRTLTYMVTRREKMKRSVCRLQEHIFTLHTKLQEQERVAGTSKLTLPISKGLFGLVFPYPHLPHHRQSPSSPYLPFSPPHPSPTSHLPQPSVPVSAGVLASPPCPALDSALLFASPAGPGAPRIEDLKWHSAFFRKRMGTSLAHSLKKPPKKVGAAGGTLLKAPSLVPPSLLSLEKTLAEARLLLTPPKNGLGTPGAPDGREPRLRLQQRPCRPAHALHGDRARGPMRREATPVRPSAPLPPAKVPTTPAGPGKNWGGFRIPKKGDRPPQGEACPPHSDCPCLGLSRLPATDRLHSPLAADPDNDGYVPDGELSDSESEASAKTFGLGRRTDAIRRSILAS